MTGKALLPRDVRKLSCGMNRTDRWIRCMILWAVSEIWTILKLCTYCLLDLNCFVCKKTLFVTQAVTMTRPDEMTVIPWKINIYVCYGNVTCLETCSLYTGYRFTTISALNFQGGINLNGIESEIRLPLKYLPDSSVFSPNPSGCCKERHAATKKKLAPTFSWIDNCLMATNRIFLWNENVTITKREVLKWKYH